MTAMYELSQPGNALKIQKVNKYCDRKVYVTCYVWGQNEKSKQRNSTSGICTVITYVFVKLRTSKLLSSPSPHHGEKRLMLKQSITTAAKITNMLIE